MLCVMNKMQQARFSRLSCSLRCALAEVLVKLDEALSAHKSIENGSKQSLPGDVGGGRRRGEKLRGSVF